MNNYIMNKAFFSKISVNTGVPINCKDRFNAAFVLSTINLICVILLQFQEATRSDVRAQLQERAIQNCSLPE